MYRKAWFSLLVAAGSVGLISGSSAVSANANTSTTITIDPATGYQTLEGWGTSLAWFAHVVGGAPNKIRAQVANLLFSDKTGLGLNVVRYNIGGGENPKYDFMQFRAAVPGYEPKPGEWNWSADANQRWFLKAAMMRGADEMEAFSNSPPYWMTISGSVTGSPNGVNNLKRSDYAQFAQYLATVVSHFKTHWGVTFQTVEPFNEPMSNWWKFGGTQEGAHFGQGAQNLLIPLLAKDLKNEKSATTIAAPDDNSIDETYTNLSNYPKRVLRDISQVNTHSYNGSARGSLSSLAAKDGKNLWMSEYGDGDETGLTMSEQILLDMKQMQPTAWVYWQALDGASSNNNSWGMLSADESSYDVNAFTVNEKYYVMGNYSKFIRPGDQFLAVNDGQSLAAYDWRAQKLVIVSTNDTLISRAVNFDLSHFGLGKASVRAYRTTRFKGTDSLKPLVGEKISRGVLRDTLPPFSVTTYVVSNADYQPNGTPLKLANLDVHKSTTYRFTGQRVLLRGDLGPSAGIAQISIDHGAFIDVDLYSAKTAKDVILYASPTLADGHHTITIRPTGRKNPLSSGYGLYVTGGISVQ